MKKNKILTLTISILFAINLSAQDSLSLSKAISIGLENNYDLKVVRNSQKIASINNTWGNTGIMPTINFNLSGRQNYNMNDRENYRTQTLVPDLNLNWVVFNGFSARIAKQKFEELEKQSEGNTAILVESTIQDIILAYYNCTMQSEITRVYKELADLSEDRYKRTLNSQDLGVSTTYDGLQAKNSWLQDKANYLQQKVNYENSVRTLNYIIAADDNSQWDLTTQFDSIIPEYKIDDLASKLKSNNKTLKNQYLYQSLLEKETAMAKSKYYPVVSLNTGLSYTGMNQYYSGSTSNLSQNSSDLYAGVTLSFTIFNGGIRKRSVRIAKINEESAQVSTNQMEHSLSNQLLQLFSNYEVQKEILLLRDEQELAAKLNLDLSTEKYEKGLINSFNFRDVQILYMNAAIARYQAKYNLVQANTDLLRITGGIIDEFNN